MHIPCPKCKPSYPLKVLQLPSSPLAYHCHQCNGNYFSSRSYHRWLETEPSAHEADTPFESPPASPDSADTLICPECRHIMIKYQVGKDVPFHLDFCRACNGVWFDESEWETLQAKDIHRQLHLIFTDAWQIKVLKSNIEERIETIFRQRVGPDAYQHIQDFKTWLATTPHKSEILAYLQNTPK